MKAAADHLIAVAGLWWNFGHQSAADGKATLRDWRRLRSVAGLVDSLVCQCFVRWAD